MTLSSSSIRSAIFTLLLACTMLAGAAEKKSTHEMSRGDVRVILLRVGNSTTTNNQPAFEVTYAVEIPKKGAFSDLKFKGEEITLAAKGVPIQGATEVSSLSTGIENLPRPSELDHPTAQPEKAILGQHVEFTGLKVKEKTVDLTIRFTWRDRQLEFPFKSVPVK